MFFASFSFAFQIFHPILRRNFKFQNQFDLKFSDRPKVLKQIDLIKKSYYE